uniref:Uncharacterized protein n=1 Tax=Chromera velia CCMP2878 TaxID=1169474 RepID=A0A0G4IFC8_9ALVE|eukprot:Cvel_13935.t1-p1 / transcript=Cvel_13935.t1 / gene=Cvel_13935 / organism=Chromera_velia_CCMP2878 / gene_product=hypothetical protein / transcript_product=hypothetical protein / location=Cvel_scaffold972:18052-31977(+) / protein_length=246 / sequence_SO=supercontig / SO=protein_coding / is_pseudo=false
MPIRVPRGKGLGKKGRGNAGAWIGIKQRDEEVPEGCWACPGPGCFSVFRTSGGDLAKNSLVVKHLRLIYRIDNPEEYLKLSSSAAKARGGEHLQFDLGGFEEDIQEAEVKAEWEDIGSDVRGGITVEDVDVDGPGVTEKGIPNTGVDVRQTGGGGMVKRGMNDGKKGDGGISLIVPNGNPRMNGNAGVNGVGGGGMQDGFGRQAGRGSPKRMRQVTHSLEGKQGMIDSGFVTPRSMGEREGEGQQM